jgi:hypothetical protein
MPRVAMRNRVRLLLPVAFALVVVLAIIAVPGESRVLGKGLRVGCENFENQGAELYVKPRTCIIFNAERTFGGSLDLHRLHWSKWSTSGAVGTGVECAFRQRCQNTRVRVTLTRLKLVHCGRNDYRSFRSAKATSSAGSTKVLPNICPQDEG